MRLTMQTLPNFLPAHAAIDVEKLAAVFDKTSQCYKFLFFRSVLNRSVRSQQILLVDILADMIEAAWWPAMHYRLTIGVGFTSHKMQELLESKRQNADERLHRLDVQAYAASLAAEQLQKQIQSGVIRWVRARLLRPWIPAKEVSEAKIDRYVARLTPAEVKDRNLPYYFADNRTIAVRQPWAEYFAANLPIITAWVDLAWLSWIQARNQNVSVTLEKLGPPPNRPSLQKQTAFLKIALGTQPYQCIFTGEPLDLRHIALDHFLPRSFVSHDRIWNLAPIAPAINSSKGARLPRPEAIAKLAAFHSEAIAVAERGHVPDWKKFREEYSCDLRLEPEFLMDSARLAEAYQGTVAPQLAIAKRMGFPPDWP